MPEADACSPANKEEQVNAHVSLLKALREYDSSVPFIEALPARTGERPRTMNCLPHAQMEQQSPDDVFNSMKAQATEMLSPFMVVAGATTVSMPSTYPAFQLRAMRDA